MDEPVSASSQPPTAALAYCERRLGPASARALRSAAGSTELARRLSAGAAHEDAVLGTVHSLARDDPELAAEFLGHFHDDILRLGHGRLSPPFRRVLDTDDLVQSMLGDLWQVLGEIRFDNRASFLSLLATRLRWKAQNRARDLRAGPRRLDRQVELPAEEIAASPTPGPPTEAAAAEEYADAAARVERLSARDRLLLQALLAGKTLDEIAAECGLEREAARLAVKRAVERSRSTGEIG